MATDMEMIGSFPELIEIDGAVAVRVDRRQHLRQLRFSQPQVHAPQRRTKLRVVDCNSDTVR